jgi:hypothetical protein
MVGRHLLEDRSKEWIPMPDEDWEEIEVDDEEAAILPEDPPDMYLCRECYEAEFEHLRPGDMALVCSRSAAERMREARSTSHD